MRRPFAGAAPPSASRVCDRSTIRAFAIIVLGLSLVAASAATADGPTLRSTVSGGDVVVSVGNVGAFDVDPDTGAARQISSGNDAYAISFSRDGTRMLFLNQTALVVADGDGRNPEQLPTDGPLDRPTLSPDGTRIAFLRDGALFVRGLRDPGPARQLTAPPTGSADNFPAWAPGGDRILVGRWTQPGGTAIEIVGVDGGEQEWSYNGAGSRYPEDGTWSPDGTRIATLEAGGVANGGLHLTVWNADGTNPNVVTPNRARPVVYAPPVWSPDGRMLAFYDWDPGSVDLVGADGLNLRTLFSAPAGQISGVTWRPHGSGVTVGLRPMQDDVARHPFGVFGTVRSIGSDPASAVVTRISTTNGAISRASLNGTPCIARGSTATCTVSSLPGDTDASLALLVTPSKPGRATVRVTATAANDSQHDDDATTITTRVSACTVLGTEGNDHLAARGGDIVCGLGGDDVIRARNGRRDVVDGGTGDDTAFVDRIDVVRHVEHVKRPKP